MAAAVSVERLLLSGFLEAACAQRTASVGAASAAMLFPARVDTIPAY
jgi:hypothetical protein